VDVRSQHGVVRREAVAEPSARADRVGALVLEAAEVLLEVAELEVAIVEVATPHLGLHARRGAELELREAGRDPVFLVVVGANAVGVEVVVGDADRRAVVDAGADARAPPGVLISGESLELAGQAVAVEERVELVAGQGRRALLAQEEEAARALARLDRR